jgi:hypothetical protein
MIGFTFFVGNNISSHPATRLSLFSDVRRTEKIVKIFFFFLNGERFFIYCVTYAKWDARTELCLPVVPSTISYGISRCYETVAVLDRGCVFFLKELQMHKIYLEVKKHVGKKGFG